MNNIPIQSGVPVKTLLSIIVVGTIIAAAGDGAEVGQRKMAGIAKTVSESKLAELAHISDTYEKALKAADLSPSPGISAEAGAVRAASTKLLSNLVEGQFQKDSVEAKAVHSAIRSTLDKLDVLIDENYEWQHGKANISPPTGTPNAAAGMNPQAIRDPKMRQQYLEALESERKKQEENVQQQELKSVRERLVKQVGALYGRGAATGLGKLGFIEAFTNEGKSREMLSALIEPPK